MKINVNINKEIEYKILTLTIINDGNRTGVRFVIEFSEKLCSRYKYMEVTLSNNQTTMKDQFELVDAIESGIMRLVYRWNGKDQLLNNEIYDKFIKSLINNLHITKEAFEEFATNEGILY